MLPILGVLLCVLMTGCMKNKILIKVSGDGSGTLLITRVFSKEVVSMFDMQMKKMKEMTDQMGASAGSMNIPDDPFYNEKSLTNEAGQFGGDVTFVKSRRYEKNGARGSMALYSFKDINKLFINMTALSTQSDLGRRAMMNDEEMEIAEKAEDAYGFSFTQGPAHKLTISVPTFPEPDTEEPEEKEDEPTPIGGPGPKQNMAMAMMMGGENPYGLTGSESESEIMTRVLKGMYFGLEIEINGSSVKSDATHTHKSKKGKNRIVLIEMNMDPMLASSKGSKMNMQAFMGQGSSSTDFFGELQNTPGMKLETKKTITVTFK